MGIEISSNFDVKTGLPLDGRTVVADLTARDAIPSLQRYIGLIVHTLSDSKNYQLQGGILNTDWVDISGSVALTLTTTGTSGAATLIGDTLNIPVYTSSAQSPFFYDTNLTAIVREDQGGAVPGDTRGAFAFDAQSLRSVSTQVAGGQSSTIFSGENNTVTGQYGTVLNGFENVSTGNFSVVHGRRGNDYGIPARNVCGLETHIQSSSMPIGCEAAEIGLIRSLNSNRGDGVSSTLILQDYQAIAFSGIVVAYQDGGSNQAAWEFSGLITRGADSSTTTIRYSTINTLYNSNGHGLTIDADISNGSLTIYYIPPNSSTYRVSGNMQTADVSVLTA